jgi:hypothetical protein
MPTPATGKDSFVYRHLNATKKFLQDATIDARCAWDGEMHRVGGLKFEFPGLRRLSTGLRSDEQTN